GDAEAARRHPVPDAGRAGDADRGRQERDPQLPPGSGRDPAGAAQRAACAQAGHRAAGALDDVPQHRRASHPDRHRRLGLSRSAQAKARRGRRQGGQGMRPRSVLILAVAAALSVALAAWAYSANNRGIAAAGEAGERLFPNLVEKANDIAEVTLRGADGAFTVKAKDGAWTTES